MKNAELIARLKEQCDRDAAEHCPAEIIALQAEGIAAIEALEEEVERLTMALHGYQVAIETAEESLKDRVALAMEVDRLSAAGVSHCGHRPPCEECRLYSPTAQQAQPVCGYDDKTGNCTRVNCCKQAQLDPFTPDWSQDSAAAESIREHQAICNLLLKEMRHIAGISTGQVKRVAEQALEAVKQAQPVCGYDDETGNCTRRVNCCKQAHPERAPLSCTWTQEDDFDTPGVYHTSCGEMWSFTEGGIKENNTKFCPHCGGGIKQGGQQ